MKCWDKKSETAYKALSMKCSHEDEILTATSTGLFCSKHGSVFDLDGMFKRNLQQNHYEILKQK